MPNEEDSEVILEGGELYNYFKLQGVDNCDVYSPKFPTFAPPTEIGSHHFVLPKQVPKEVLDIVNAILNSKLLLEEDAIYLFQNSSELVPENKNIVGPRLVLPGIIIAICTYGFWRLSNLKKFWISVMTCSSIVLLDGVKDILHLLNYTDDINNLLNNLQVVISYIRKHIKLIQEEDSLINSKQKILHLRNNENIINIYTIKRKRAEISIISKKVIVILKSLILLSRNITLAILKIEKKKSINNISYIALYSDEQLGINRQCEELDKEASWLPLIDSLKNIYVMMQSETLRELGLCLCESAEALKISKLFNILHHYKSQLSTILLELSNLYETHFYPSYAPEKINCVNNEIRCINNILNSISCALNGLLIDSRILQEYINENSNESSSQTVGQKLLDMEREITYLLEHMHASSQQLLNQTDFTQIDVPIIPTNNEKIIKTGYTVGISDFSVAGHDEVFLGYVDGTENSINNSENIEEYAKPTYLNSLMGELKTALISKREDFEKREIKALKSNQDLESYKACSTEYDKSVVLGSNLLHFQSSSIVEQNVSVFNPSVAMLENTYSSFSNDLTTKAINLFRTWNKKNNEEYFGDESDGEGSEASLCKG